MTEVATLETGNAASAVRALPAWTYRNAELNELEYELLFRPSWQFACHVSDVRKPGDLFTVDLGRDSVLVVRGKDGELRAFLNACRHRGSKLRDDGPGHCKARLVCPYHGWAYNLKGDLVGLPAESTFPGIDKKQLGLKQVEVEVMVGLVFVRVVPGGCSLAEMWKDYLHMLEPYRIEEMVPLDTVGGDVWKCNWKVGVDNNAENYHVVMGHPGYHRMLDNDMQGFMNEHGVSGSLSVLRAEPSSNWAERMYQRLAPGLDSPLPEDLRSTWMFFCMPPAIGLDFYIDSMDVFSFLPKDAETCYVRYQAFGYPDAQRDMKSVQYLNARINTQVTQEDKDLSERVQLGLNSYGFEFGPMSNYETLIHDYHERVRQACPVASLPEAPPAGEIRRINAEMLAEQEERSRARQARAS